MKAATKACLCVIAGGLVVFTTLVLWANFTEANDAVYFGVK